MPSKLKDARCNDCGICSQLDDYEFGRQTVGREDQDTFLPSTSERFKTARDLKPKGGLRQLLLLQCPECGTYYLFKSDYEYLATGSEEEQTLTRLTDEKAAEYMQQPLKK